MEQVPVAVVGGGVIGLSLALELRLRGLEVAILTRDLPGEAGHKAGIATPSSAGMLALGDPRHPVELFELMELSRQLYPAFLERVASFSGERVPLETTLRRNLNADGSYHDMPEPTLDARKLWRALEKACRAAGAQVRQCEVQSVEAIGSDFLLHTTEGTVTAERWVNCAGAWASRLEGSGIAEDAVAPRRGQMVRLENTSGHDHVLYTDELYLVPRLDGTILAGASVEDAGFDHQVQPERVQQYREHAAVLLPALKGARLLETWAGLRPGTADHLPLIGQLEPGAYIATGHFRDGILLAPATARVMGELMCGEQTSVPLEAFSPYRFTRKSDNRFAAAL